MSNKSRAQNKRSEPYVYMQINTESEEEQPEGERIIIFKIDDREYTIPDPIPAFYVARYLKRLRVMDDFTASQQTIDEVMGQDALDALATCEQMTPQQLKAILEFVAEKLIGTVKEVLGK